MSAVPHLASLLRRRHLDAFGTPGTPASPNTCLLVWKGLQQTSFFIRWRVRCDTRAFFRSFPLSDRPLHESGLLANFFHRTMISVDHFSDCQGGLLLVWLLDDF